MKDLKMKIELNMKSIMLYEQLTGKSFYEVTEQDLPMLLYALLVVNNPQYKVTIQEFDNILENKKISGRLLESLQEEMAYEQSLSATATPSSSIEDKDEEAPKERESVRITDIIGQMITTFHMDINYVMEKMKLWELTPYAKAIENALHQDMEDKRFWTYLSIMPHIDAKKIGGPQKFLPFEWEKEENESRKIDTGKKADQFAKDNTDKIKAFFNRSNQENKEDKNKIEDEGWNEAEPERGRFDDSQEQAGPAGEGGSDQGCQPGPEGCSEDNHSPR